MSPSLKVGPALLALVGPTAAGKSEAAVAVAPALGAEILCVDSTLVHRGMDVGTAKPTREERAEVPHHLLDLIDPGEPFTVRDLQRRFDEAAASVRARGRRVLAVGSGGLYYRAVADRLRFPGTDPADRASLELEAGALGPEALHERLRALDPAAAGRIQASNVRRTVRALEVIGMSGRSFSSFAADWERYPPGIRAAGVAVPREILHARIDSRVRDMVSGGLIEETGRLLEAGAGPFLSSSRAIGYAESVAVLRGEMDLADAAARIASRTKALARRQMAWLRRDPRIVWFEAGPEGAMGLVDRLVEYLGGDGPAAVEA